MINNEKGLMFPVAILLLFFIVGFVLFYISSYQTQINIITSLENINVHATMVLLENNK